MIFHVSDLNAAARCTAEFGYKRAGLPTSTNSGAAFGTVMHHCHAGSTRFITWDGIKTLGETAGTTQRVLANGGSEGPQWVDAKIRSFGEQRLYAITLTRGGTRRRKTIYATDEHRHFVRTRFNRNSECVETLTRDLKPGDWLRWQFPRSAVKRTEPSTIGIAHGITFGDGTREKYQARLDLWGWKRDLLPYFGPAKTTERPPTDGGVVGLSVRNLPLFFKELPDENEGPSYLFGWLAGYFAVDGCVGSNGAIVLACADRKVLEFVELIALRLGIASESLTEQPYGKDGYKSGVNYRLTLIPETIPDTFWINPKHRERAKRVPEYRGWRVESVVDSGIVEEVFCAVVPEHQNFTLEDWVNTGNCVNLMDREVAQGRPIPEALQLALENFAHYWIPANIVSLCDPVPTDGWLRGQSYGALRERGLDVLRKYADLLAYDDSEILATEYGFAVPIQGTWDEEKGEPHILAGSVDRLATRKFKRRPFLAIDDWKTGKEYPFLRQNLQGTGYSYASTQPEFWTGWQGEDGFGNDRGTELYRRFEGLPRRFTWINLRTVKHQDGGWRGPKDYQRFAVAVEQLFALIQADAYPLSISGENCRFCDMRKVCAGVGLANDDHGSPFEKTR